MNKKDLIAHRAFKPDDINFIYSSWLQALRDGNSWYAEIDHDVYYEKYKLIVQNILNRPTILISIACLFSDPDVILGYCVYEGKTLHWVYVKEVWRRIGISSDLIPEFESYTHTTARWQSIRKRKYLTAKFNPFLI